MKSDKHLGDLRKQKMYEKFSKKELSKQFEFFLIVKFPMRPELVILSPSVYMGLDLIQFVVLNSILIYYLFKKQFNLKKNYTKSKQIMPNNPCSNKNSILNNSSKKQKKIVFVSNSAPNELFDDTTNISLR